MPLIDYLPLCAPRRLHGSEGSARRQGMRLAFD
jgi:hypothetical protein